MKNKIDIIIPFYNPKHHIIEVLTKNIYQLFNDNYIEDFNIILVNDGSTDRDFLPYVEELISLYNGRIFLIDLSKNKGKGGAIKEGFKKSTSPIIAFYDIDFPFGIEALYQLYDKLQSDDDIIISKRDETYISKLPWKRKIISQVIKYLMRFFSNGKIADSQAGLKGMKEDVKHLIINTKTDSFMMDFEFLLKASQSQYRINAITVTPNHNIEFTNFSNATLFREIKNFIKILRNR